MSRKKDFEPKIVTFACNWCSYPAADTAGVGRMQYAPDIRIVRVMCSGRVDPAFVLRAFERGADGVLITGCHLVDCHYLFGARVMEETYKSIQQLVHLLGIEPERLRYEQISAAEAAKFVRVVNEFVESVKKVGPRLDSDPGDIGGGKMTEISGDEMGSIPQ
ncbi:MAG: hydrogenase iron-sulfur subunit [Candidatus Neomarinimicrobiota bacterium]